MSRTIRQKRSQKKTWLWILPLLVAATLIVAVCITVRHHRDEQIAKTSTNPIVKQENKINYLPPSKDEQQTSNQQKDDIVNGTSTPVNNSLGITITRVFQDTSGANIRTVVSGTTTGTCEATFSKAGQANIVKSFPVVFDATTAGCQNTPVGLNEFPVGGDWNIQIIIKKDASQSPAASSTITITK